MATHIETDHAHFVGDELTALFEADLTCDQGDAALSHLREGRSMHYVENTTSDGHVIREQAGGVRELLKVEADGSTHVVCTLQI